MTTDRLKVQVIRSLDELETIRARWDNLLASYPLATTFSTPEWLIPWWCSFGHDQQLRVLSFLDDESRLVALAPLSWGRIQVAKAVPLKRLRFMGDGSKDSDNLDLPVRPGFEKRFAETLLEFLQRAGGVWDFCELNTVPPQSPGADALWRALGNEGWMRIEKQSPASAIPLAPTWEEYLNRLSSENHKNLERYERRLKKRYAVAIYRCGEENQLPKCLNALFMHHQARWHAVGEAGSFGAAERRTFYFDLSRRLLAQGQLDLWVLELDGKVAAAQFGFRYGDRFFQLQEGNDPAHASDRVGFLLRGHVIKELIAQRVRVYDFLGGALGYKADWGAEAGHYVNLQFARPFSAGAAYLRAQLYREHSKLWLRRKLPQSAWQFLHRAKVKLRSEN